MAVSPPICDFGWAAPDFLLSNLDGELFHFADIAGENGTLIMFLSNHCPYVKAIETRIARDAQALQKLGIGVAAICSNDALSYPDDGPIGMQEQADRAGFSFPYLHDETQAVARAYDAVCTPDFFGFDAKGGLQYRGRLDASRRETGAENLRRDLYEALKGIAETGHGPHEQIPSMGCSIKWK
ncbi:MAG TPA: thioredoxin family protein [Hellea balneolensis]|uniref:Thioredoxin family protein n=1 Tax=Hellea balneolensis TaxID=287478 RepID=A0A7C3GAA2_9PROT|nr:thioredoxin family protein [Hellea balneolensis]